MIKEMFNSYFQRGNVIPYSSTQDLFMQDVRAQNYKVPTKEQERQLFLDIREKRIAYERANDEEKRGFLTALNESRSKAAELYIRFIITFLFQPSIFSI